VNLFVYGSLKKGFFNHNRFGFGTYAKFLGKGTARNVSLVRMGSLPYPHAFKNEGGEVRGELYELKDKRIAAALEDMEIGAGYQPLTVTVNGREATMYVAADYLIPQLQTGEVMSEWTETN
jgi:gamma-glutamylcyclotransferase (GGCT)/AIG2-like uncharacterized protein YtfP